MIDRRSLGYALLAAVLAPAAASGAVVDRHGLGATRIPLGRLDGDYIPPASVATIADMYRRMTAAIMLNGQGPFSFVVDTGANQSVLSVELATQLGLTFGPEKALNGVAGVQFAPTAIVELSVAGRARPGVELSVLPQAAIGGAGLLGLDCLDGQRLTLDFRRQQLRIESHRFYDRNPDDIAVKARRRDGQLTFVNADLAGVPVVAFLDSGAQNTIGNRQLQQLAMLRNPKSLWTPTPIVSATGQTIDAEIADLPMLRIGGMRLPNWPVAFADLHTFKLWSLIDKPAVLIGVDVMSRFEAVCLDFGRDEVRFRLPRRT